MRSADPFVTPSYDMTFPRTSGGVMTGLPLLPQLQDSLGLFPATHCWESGVVTGGYDGIVPNDKEPWTLWQFTAGVVLSES